MDSAWLFAVFPPGRMGERGQVAGGSCYLEEEKHFHILNRGNGSGDLVLC